LVPCHCGATLDVDSRGELIVTFAGSERAVDGFVVGGIVVRASDLIVDMVAHNRPAWIAWIAQLRAE